MCSQTFLPRGKFGENGKKGAPKNFRTRISVGKLLENFYGTVFFGNSLNDILCICLFNIYIVTTFWHLVHCRLGMVDIRGCWLQNKKLMVR